MKQVFKVLLLVVLTPFLLALPFAIRGHYAKTRIERQVWAQAESIRQACDVLRSNTVAESRQRIISVDPEGPHVPAALQALHPGAIEVLRAEVASYFRPNWNRTIFATWPHWRPSSLPPGMRTTRDTSWVRGGGGHPAGDRERRGRGCAWPG
jgi:hypothetical protein